MSCDSDRQELRAAQTAVIEAVIRGHDYPPGFEPERLDTAHDGILRKRAWAVAGAWPAMARSLGPAYLELFSDYVSRKRPFPPEDGSLLDGLWFGSYLARIGRLPDLGRVQTLSFHLHYQVRHGSIARRRGLWIRLTLLRRPPYLLIGARGGGGCVHVWRVPLTRRRIR